MTIDAIRCQPFLILRIPNAIPNKTGHNRVDQHNDSNSGAEGDFIVRLRLFQPFRMLVKSAFMPLFEPFGRRRQPLRIFDSTSSARKPV